MNILDNVSVLQIERDAFLDALIDISKILHDVPHSVYCKTRLIFHSEVWTTAICDCWKSDIHVIIDDIDIILDSN